jgi:DNA-3-methyladenine glycosylase I
MENLIIGEDGLPRCGWCGTDPLYQAYHDDEWGTPAFDDRRQFEFVILESAQAGLSWFTILRKREAYREAYAGFDPELVSRWGDSEINQLMTNPGIVKNRRKIEASVGNARIFLEISGRHGSFAKWLLKFFDGMPQVNNHDSLESIPVTSPRAESISKELKSMGFKFFGPVIAYSHLQATGIVDDHLTSCWRRKTGRVEG